MFLFKSVPEDRKGRNVTKFSISIPKLYKNTTKRRKRQISFLMNIDMHIFQKKKKKVLSNRIQGYIKILLPNQVDFTLGRSDCEFSALHGTSMSTLSHKVQRASQEEGEDQR